MIDTIYLVFVVVKTALKRFSVIALSQAKIYYSHS